MNQLLITLLMVLVFLTGCSQDESPKEKMALSSSYQEFEEDLAPGVKNRSIVSKAGDILRYTISIPEGFEPNKPTPLIVALHYGGKVTPHYARNIVEALINRGLGELNAIVVAPDSVAGPWTNETNEKMVLDLMDHINQKYNIDQNKTLLTGFSMGGHGTWYIGSRNQDRFSALIPIASSPVVEKDVQWTTPVYVIHSRADTTVGIEAVEEYVAAQKAEGNDQIVFAAVEDLHHFDTHRFSDPLKSAVPWVEKIWADESPEE